jgi:hypothetical protein
MLRMYGTIIPVLCTLWRGTRGTTLRLMRIQPLQNTLLTQPRDYTSAVYLTSVTSDTSRRKNLISKSS